MSLMNSEAVDAATETALAMGVRVFNGALFGQDETEHVDVLLELLDPPEDAMVIDMGAGVGEMARLMHERRPDLRFLLVNTSQVQLELCPPDFDRLLGDYERLETLPDGCADAIVFSYALCHAEWWMPALNEARRLLKPGGTLLVNDMAFLGKGPLNELEAILGARAWSPEGVEAWMREAGFLLEEALAPDVGVDRLADMLTADGIDPGFLADIVPTVWRAIRLDDDAAMWTRHQGNIGFQFSGGRDSTTALYLLRSRWREMRVFHVDTGDQFPELRAVVDQVEADLLAAGVALERIVTDVKAQRARDGLPSDVIPVDHTALGQMVSGNLMRITGRFDCCAAALMNPLHQRMIDAGITLLIRGQRDDEYAGGAPTRDRDQVDGFEVHYPLQDWTAEQVQAYLDDNDLPVAPFYREGMKRAPECMGCTAWWDEGRLGYMQKHYPTEHAVVKWQIELIAGCVAGQLKHLEA